MCCEKNVDVKSDDERLMCIFVLILVVLCSMFELINRC